MRLNKTKEVSKVIQIYMKIRLNLGLNGDSNDAQQSTGIQMMLNKTKEVSMVGPKTRKQNKPRDSP